MESESEYDMVFSQILHGKYTSEKTQDITFGLISFAESYLTRNNLSLKKHMPDILTSLNPNIVLPTEYSSLSRKIKRAQDRGATDHDIVPFILPEAEPSKFAGQFCERYNITKSDLDSTDGLFDPPVSVKLTNGLIYELEVYRRQRSHSWKHASGWVKSLFQVDVHCEHALTISWTKLHTTVQTKQKNSAYKAAYQEFLETSYTLPKPRPTPKQVLQNKLDNIPTAIQASQNPLLEMASYTGAAIGNYVQKTEAKIQRRETKIDNLKIALQEKTNSMQKKADVIQDELDKSLEDQKEVNAENSTLKQTISENKQEISDLEEKYRACKPKNVKRREETKVKTIKKLESEKKQQEKQHREEISNLNASHHELEEQNQRLQKENQDLNTSVSQLKQSKLNSQKLVSKWKRIAKKQDAPSEIQDLKEEVRVLENENEKLKESLNQFMQDAEVTTFEDGRYSDVVRQVCHILISEGVSMSKTEKVIRTVLTKLANKNCGRLPCKSSLSNMAAECDILSKIHVGQLLLDEAESTLHLDGTKKKFREYASFQISTNQHGSKSLGFEEMPAGAASDYLDATKNLFHEIACLLSSHSSQTQEQTEARLLKNIRNTQTDRHTVNKSYKEQLKEYKASVLPHIIEDFNNLTAKEISDAVRINGLMCGMHAVHGVGTVTKEALKDFEQIAAPGQEYRGFKKSDARAYTLMWEMSKAFTQGHNYQKCGVTHYFEAYLSSKKQKNHLISLRGERIGVIFVLGAAAFFHRNQILEFLAEYKTGSGDKTNNRLVQSIQDLELPIMQAELRSLGILGKLLTSPLMRIIEAPQQHILELNDMWLHVINKLEEFSVNSSPLLEAMEFVPNSTITKDEVYQALFAPQSPEVDELTEDCLRLLCCNAAVLLKRQLADQLPGGIFYKPSDALMKETKSSTAHNIISERDFAQLDRQITHKPCISTITLSGVVAFSNNRTPDYLEKLPEEERHAIMAKSIKQARINRKITFQRKKEIKQKRFEEMEKKREKREADEKVKEERKIEATNELMRFGGLWCDTDTIELQMKNLKEKDMKKAVQAQLRYRRLVLDSSSYQNKTLFHLSSKGKAKDLGTLVENLKEIVVGAVCTDQAPVVTPKASTSTEERKEKIDEAVKRKSTENISDESPKQKFPDLVGKSVMHKWEENGVEEWVYGKVLKAKGSLTDIQCEFVVQYNDGVFEVPLYQDFNSGDLTIVWYTKTKPNRSSEVHVISLIKISYYFSSTLLKLFLNYACFQFYTKNAPIANK